MSRALVSILTLLLIATRPVQAGEATGDDLVEKGLRPSTLTPRDADPVYAPLRYAIVVGVNATAEPTLHPLQYAEHDAEQVASSLKATDIGAFDRVVSLSRASRREILAALEDAQRLLRGDDLFLFYFSGHGTASIDDSLRSSLFLLARDSNLVDLEHTAVSVREVQERLAAMRPRRKVLVVDACYNGDGKSALSPQSHARKRQMKGMGQADLIEPPRESEAHLFAAAVGQPALEDVTLGGGVYTYYFLRALSQDPAADLNHDGAISVSEAHSYSRDQTMNRTGYRQVPWANYRIVGREDIYLAGRRRAGAEQALIYSFNERYGGARVYLNGREKGTLPSAIDVEPGTYQVVLKAPDGSELFSRKVQLEADHSVRVDDLQWAIERARNSARTAQVATLSIAGGLGVAAAITGLQTLSLKTYYDTASFQTLDQAEEVRIRGERYRLATNMLLGGSVVSGLVSSYIYIRAPKWVLRPFGDSRAQVLPVISPEGAQVAFWMGF